MSKSMVERVARAIWESEPIIYNWGPQEPWNDAIENKLAGVAIFRQFARVAIETMQEPTPTMIDATLPPTKIDDPE